MLLFTKAIKPQEQCMKKFKILQHGSVRLDSMYSLVENLLDNRERKLNKIQLKKPMITQ